MSTPRILFVDDESLVLRALSRALHFNFDLTTAYSAQEASALLDGPNPFDVVITDFNMPGEDGLAMIERVAEKHPYTRFIVLTGNQEPEVRARAEASPHVYRFLQKPAGVEDVTDAICDAVKSINAVGLIHEHAAAARD